ncbi:MAG: YidC/Oxa1 family rane protein insertase [Patescibacteria group bacterium]|nr:YidC/Oxa1 family rane protein insertase [Patescibacteria group bacterium]
MFTTLVIQPIFNLLVAIYALLPGHNFGIALIVFTVVIRALLWPLVRKQLRHTKITQKLQPELKRIKKEAKGDKQKESLLMMELYKERGINPLGSLPVTLVQMAVLIGLYMGLTKLLKDTTQISSFAYGFLQHLGSIKEIAANPKLFDNTLFGIVDLARPAVGPRGFYLPAFILVMGSALVQYLSTKQIMSVNKDARTLRDILKAASEGEEVDAFEKNAAIGRSMGFFIPVMVFVFTIGLAAALSLYWFVGGLIALYQQNKVLKEDEEDMHRIADAPTRGKQRDTSKIAEAEIVSEVKEAKNANSSGPTPQNKKSKKTKKRRR